MAGSTAFTGRRPAWWKSGTASCSTTSAAARRWHDPASRGSRCCPQPLCHLYIHTIEVYLYGSEAHAPTMPARVCAPIWRCRTQGQVSHFEVGKPFFGVYWGLASRVEVEPSRRELECTLWPGHGACTGAKTNLVACARGGLALPVSLGWSWLWSTGGTAYRTGFSSACCLGVPTG